MGQHQIEEKLAEVTSSFIVECSATIKQAMKHMSKMGEKEIFVVDRGKRLLGALSDGDIRKWILRGGSLKARVDKVCNKTPKFVEENYSLDHVKKTMLKLKIESMPVVYPNRQIRQILTWDDVFAGQVSKHKEQLDVPVVIMAGGKGTRLDPFTKILPKPLVPIGEKPVIEIIMDQFHEFGITDFYLTLNHKARMIKSYFEEANEKYKITYIEEDKPLGTAGSLRLLKGKLRSPFLVTNSDIIIEGHYGELVKFHKDHGNALTVVVSCRHYVIPYGVCEIENGGTLKKMKEKPSYDLLVNTGMYVVNAEVLDFIPRNEAFDMTELIQRLKEEDFKVAVFPIDEHAWIDVGQWDEYQRAIEKFGV